MNLSALTNLEHLLCEDCALTSLVVSSAQPIVELLASGNNLDTAAVNSILVAVGNNGVANGDIDVSGQAANAHPTELGAVNAAKLTANGWTVTKDAGDPLFFYTPYTANLNWNDGGGGKTGDLEDFYQTKSGSVTNISLSGTAITSIDSLSGFDANLHDVLAAGCGSLTAVYGRDLASLTGDLDLSGCDFLVTATFPNLSTVSGSLDFEDDLRLATLSMPDVLGCTNFTISGCASLTTLDLDSAVTFTNFFGDSLSSLVSLDLPSTTGITSTLSLLASVIDSIDAINLSYVGYIYAAGCSYLFSVNSQPVPTYWDFQYCALGIATMESLISTAWNNSPTTATALFEFGSSAAYEDLSGTVQGYYDDLVTAGNTMSINHVLPP